uniref:Uncharacterized protein n=1 Tax=Coccolithus braarudii TaxID=221442 RepID=A0A7S0LPZ9_9EUKA|mmetsp:Transcript_5221/g.11460  ORF Transcript_5221/g.11460 Transcript_5221/m.11460 type:complete len:161 (+) Transcript_5221:198-680(+)
MTYGGTHADYNDMQQCGLSAEVHICPAYDMRTPAPEQLSILADATWGHAAGSSVSAKVFYYNHAAVRASLNGIPSTQLSSNEAESWVQASAEADGLWLINYLTEISEPPTGPVPVQIDNSIAVEQAHANCSPPLDRVTTCAASPSFKGTRNRAFSTPCTP